MKSNTKNYVLGPASLESDSELVIKKLTKGFKTKPVGRTAVAQLYDRDGVEVGVPAAATGNDIDGYNIMLPLPRGEDQDFTIIIIERNDADPSDPADLFAARQNPDVAGPSDSTGLSVASQKPDVAAPSDPADLSAASQKPDVAAPSDPADLSAASQKPDVAAPSDPADLSAASQKPGVAAPSDPADLSAASQKPDVAEPSDPAVLSDTSQKPDVEKVNIKKKFANDETLGDEQAPYATSVCKLLSMPPAEVEVINNCDKNSATNSYMIIKTVQAGGTTPRPAREGTEFRLYEVIDTSGTKTSGKLVSGIIQPISSSVDFEGGVVIKLPKDIMTKNGTEYYLSAIESNKLESDKALIGAVKSGITINRYRRSGRRT